jgi:TatD DNase family protein
MLPYTDTHAHLSGLARRGIDPIAKLAELSAAGFGAILDVGTEAEDLRGRISAFGGFSAVRFSAGIWPSAEAIKRRQELLSSLVEAVSGAERGYLAAVGECGFDRHWNRADSGADIEGERELFIGQAELAVELDLPLIVHSREAMEETAEAIAAVPGLRGVIHCFSYGIDEARRFLDLGFHISFAGTVTYKSAGTSMEAARFVPKDRLLLETDSPYLAPAPFRGKPADPGMIGATYEKVAAARMTSVSELAELIAQNAAAVFGLPTPS